MRVIVNNHVYGMTRKQLNGILDIARKQVPNGIYAIEKNGVCELMKDTFDSVGELEKAVSEYKSKGFKVLHNDLIIK